MRKNITRIIIGFVVLAAVGIAAYCIVKFIPEPGSDVSSAPVPDVAVISAEINTVETVEIKNWKSEYTVRKTGNLNWAIEELDGLPVSKSTYETLATQSSSLRAVAAESGYNDDMAVKYGLDNPVASAKITYTGGREVFLKIGKKHAIDSKYYLHVDGDDTVYLATDADIAAFFYEKYLYIDRLLIPMPSTPDQSPTITDYKITRPDLEKPIEIALLPEDVSASNTAGLTSPYGLESPFHANLQARSNSDEKYQVSVDYIMQLVYGFTAFKTEDIQPDAEKLAKYGFDNPTAVLEVKTTHGDYKLILGKTFTCEQIEDLTDLPTDHSHKHQGHYLMKEGVDVVYMALETGTPWVTISVQDMISGLILVPHIDSLQAVEVVSGGKTEKFVLTGEKDEMKVRYNNEKPINTEEFRSFYVYLLQAPAEEIYTGTPAIEAGISAETKVTYIYDDTDRKPDVIEYIPVGLRRYVVRVNGEENYICRSEYVDRLQTNLYNIINEYKIVPWQ